MNRAWASGVVGMARRLRARLKPLTRPVGRVLERVGVLPSHGPEEVLLVARLLKRRAIRGVMLDVGAHFGTSLAPFLEDGWAVHAFEPDASNRAALIAAFGARAALRIDARAISDEAIENAAFFASTESTGVSTLRPFLASHVASSAVRVTTLRNYCAEVELDPRDVRFLKIDTEGHDLMVLRGYPWEVAAPDAIVCEFEDAKTVPLGYTHADLAEFLVDRGYSLIVSEWHPVVRYGAQHRWRRFAPWPCVLEDPRAWGNFIALRDPELIEAAWRVCRQHGSWRGRF